MVEMTQAIALLHTARRLIRGTTTDEAIEFLADSEVFLVDAGHKPRYGTAPVIDLPLSETNVDDLRGLPTIAPDPDLAAMIAANIAPLDTIAPEPADTPPALFPMSELHVEAALCLWEAALEMQARSSATQGNPLTGDEVVPHVALVALLEEHGTAVMRHAIMQLAPACCAEWDLLDDQQQEALAPFDWEFVPAFLRRCITDGRLLIAIENQYRKDADRLPIAAFPAP